jgi:hypothetical protein
LQRKQFPLSTRKLKKKTTKNGKPSPVPKELISY